MNKLVTLVFLVSAAGIGAAGYQLNDRWVTVTPGSYASGALGASRAAANTNEYIGCHVYAGEAYNFKSVTCYARDKYRVTATCYSDNPAIVQAAAGLNGDSYIGFSYHSGGDCMSLRIDTYSYDAPKQ